MKIYMKHKIFIYSSVCEEQVGYSQAYVWNVQSEWKVALLLAEQYLLDLPVCREQIESINLLLIIIII